MRDDVPAYKVCELTVDAADPERIARWWADVFGVEARNEGRGYWWIEEVPGMPFESMLFDPVPEPKTVKNRLHWDVYGDVDGARVAGRHRARRATPLDGPRGPRRQRVLRVRRRLKWFRDAR